MTDKWFDFWWPIFFSFLWGMVLGCAIGINIIQKLAIENGAGEWQVDKYGKTSFTWKTPEKAQK